MTELEIRERLVAVLEASPEEFGASFIAEMFIGSFSRRADLIVANGKLSAYEIKGPRDSLERLQGQLSTYLQHFEQVTIVCASRHVEEVVRQVPACVGVFSVADSGQISIVRRAATQMITRKETWLSFLPVDEIRQLLRSHGVKSTGARGALVQAADRVPLSAMRDYVLAYLKRRDARVATLKAKRTAQLFGRETRPAEDHAERVDQFLKACAGSGIAHAIPRRVA